MKYRTVSNQLINNRPNNIDTVAQENFLCKLLEAEKQQLLEQQQQLQQHQLSVKSTKTSNLSMKDKSSTSLSVCGLNNLGNTCFFNAVLQNIAQAPGLEELLSENLKSNDFQLTIKHNDDYDSELTDFEEDSSFCLKSSETKSNIREESNDEENACNSNNEDKQMDFNNNSKSRSDSLTSSQKSSDSQTHRSIRLKDLNIVLTETPGPLTRSLYELIKLMNTTNSTVNPSSFHSAFCKKIPHFKGFQQHDSHELLRNLLDSVKSEELKRRQSAILGQFKINKSKGVDDLTKKIIKRYGRLSSHTFIDKLFGGHLLSSIVCEECKSCTQRVEPFLDLSLPIVDEHSKFISETNDSEKNGGTKLKKDYKRSSFLAGKKGKKSEESKDDAGDVIDPKENVLSKHQSKKQKKLQIKKGKKKNKQNSTAEANVDEEDNDVFNKEKQDDDEENIQKPNEEISTNIDPQVVEEKEPVESAATTEINQKLEDLNLREEICDTPTEQIEDLNETYSDNDDTSNDLENRFKLDSMISLSTNKLSSNEKGVASLESCLNNFTSIETLSDKINCDNCTSKLNENSNTCKYKHSLDNNSKKKASKQQNSNKVYTKAIKQYLICDLPRILTIHLKRFQQQGFRLEKSNKHVNFPLILNMAPYTSKMCINLSLNKQAMSNRCESQATGEVLYSLYGIVEHSGKLNFGHYTAYIKSRNKLNITQFLGTRRLCHLKKVMKTFRDNSSKCKEETSENLLVSNSKEELNDLETAVNNNSNELLNEASEKWYYISDAHVSEVSVAKVLKVQAYILFYERVK